MKHTAFAAAFWIVPALIFAPLFVAAQTSTDTGYRSYGWNQRSSDFQQKVSALGEVADPNIPMPVLFGVAIKDISPNYGVLRASGRIHEGEDIMATKGTPIVSPTPAVVIRTNYGTGEGNSVYTANPGGETFIYYHLDRIAEGIVAGQVLARGSLIGYVGNTGDAAGGAAHLHFEIRKTAGNTATDPFVRLTLEFTPEEKMAYLSKILTQTSDHGALAQFLVTNFRSAFATAMTHGAAVPPLILNLIASAATPTQQTSTPLSGTPIVFTRNMYRGVSGEDVRALQQILNRSGFTVAVTGAGSPGSETAYFGLATQAAVIKYQVAHSLPPFGYFGILTRASFVLLRA